MVLLWHVSLLFNLFHLTADSFLPVSYMIKNRSLKLINIIKMNKQLEDFQSFPDIFLNLSMACCSKVVLIKFCFAGY